jgi:methanogenic corrinoid protein MtbC1
MKTAELFKQYLEHLFAGKRCEARELVFAALDRGVGASKLLKHIVWPAMEQIEKLYRQSHISLVMEHMATRINRMVADQLHAFLAREPKHGKRMIVLCGEGEKEELGAQMAADLFEAGGWSVWFLGSGVPNDEIVQFAGKANPDVLFIYGTLPSEVPSIRALIEMFRDIGICEDMQVLVGGGVFNRAEGLAEEVKADLYAADIAAALKTVADHPVRIPKPDVPEPGRRRKRKRKVAAATTTSMRKTQPTAV